MHKTYFEPGDIVICTDTSGPSILEVERNSEYIVEEVRPMCYIKLKGISQTQKIWRFRLAHEFYNDPKA